VELDKVYCMDVLEGLRMLPGESVDMVVCDPPYGINFYTNNRKKNMIPTARGTANDGVDNDAFLADVITELNRVLKQGTHLYWFTRWDKVKVQQPLLDRYFTVKNSLIWDKNGVSMGDLKGAYASSYENILFAHKGRRELNVDRGQACIIALWVCCYILPIGQNR
jgi:DNA modification methylase